MPRHPPPALSASSCGTRTAEAAQQVTLNAAAKVEATGLTSPAEAAAFAQMLCTCAYTAAQADDRDRALEMIGDAERAAARLPQHPVQERGFTVTSALVTLYKVGALWSHGAAVHAGSTINPKQLPTAERRGRLHTDLARSWWQWGKPEQTAHALLAAHREAPAEVGDRPSIRGIVTTLAERHPRTSGVRELMAAVHGAHTPLPASSLSLETEMRSPGQRRAGPRHQWTLAPRGSPSRGWRSFMIIWRCGLDADSDHENGPPFE